MNERLPPDNDNHHCNEEMADGCIAVKYRCEASCIEKAQQQYATTLLTWIYEGASAAFLFM